jgi:putative PIN family toxin of toxin-antitoxin system
VERVTADSNIWVSGLNWRGQPHEFLNLARSGQIQLSISDAVLDEFTRILHDKLEWSDERLNALRAEVATFTRRVSPIETLDAVPRDADDNRIIECAVAAGSDAIITGDDDLLSLGSFRGIEIIKVATFLARFSGRQR